MAAVLVLVEVEVEYGHARSAAARVRRREHALQALHMLPLLLATAIRLGFAQSQALQSHPYRFRHRLALPRAGMVLATVATPPRPPP